MRERPGPETTPALLALVSALSLVACSSPPEAGSDWSLWRGPRMDGTVPSAKSFDGEFSLELAWTHELGPGYSGISVADRTVLTMASDGRVDRLVALDADTGRERWTHALGPMRVGQGGAADGPLSTPVVLDGVVLALGPRGNLAAVRLEDGVELWSVDLASRLGARAAQHGFATTPLVVGEVVIVQTGSGAGRSIQVLDARNGEPRTSLGDDEVGYSSPVLAQSEHGAIALAAGNGEIVAFGAADGRVRFRHPHASPITDGHAELVPLGSDRLLVHYIGGSMLLELPSTPDGAVREVWRTTELRRSLCPPVQRDGMLYGFQDEQLVALDAETGTLVWRRQGLAARGVILVGGHLVLLETRGDLVIAPASRAGFVESARIATRVRDGYTWPSFAAGVVFVRNLERIAAVRVRRG